MDQSHHWWELPHIWWHGQLLWDLEGWNSVVQVVIYFLKLLFLFKIRYLVKLCFGLIYKISLSLRMINHIQPGSIKKINESKMAFKCMENIDAFLKMARQFGVPAQETFQTVDLWERQNLNSVVICLQSLGRKVCWIFSALIVSLTCL